MQQSAKTVQIKKIYADYKKDSVLGKNYDFPVNNSFGKTKTEILIVSTILFSQKGYHSVSIRDIANVIGIKASSIYNHYKNKEELWKNVILHSMKLHSIYISELNKKLKNCNKTEDMLDIIFYEPKKMDNIFTCFAFGVVQRERIYNEFAGKIFSKMHLHTVKTLTKHFKRCTDINVELNTDLIAMIYLCMVFFGINNKARDMLKVTSTYDFAELYSGIQKILLMGIQA